MLCFYYVFFSDALPTMGMILMITVKKIMDMIMGTTTAIRKKQPAVGMITRTATITRVRAARTNLTITLMVTRNTKRKKAAAMIIRMDMNTQKRRKAMIMATLTMVRENPMITRKKQFLPGRSVPWRLEPATTVPHPLAAAGIPRLQSMPLQTKWRSRSTKVII